MTLLRRLLVAAILGGIVVAGLLTGCEKFKPGSPDENIPPETTLSFSPEQGDTASYKVRMNWFGWDPDGEIAYFKTKWDTFDWVTVVNTDSVFYVSASADTVTEEKGFEYHSFSVAAVDDDGAVDETPETVSFTAYTIVPETSFLTVGGGPTGVTGPMVTFRWSAIDRDGVIVAYQYRLERYDHPDWVQVLPDPETGEEWVEVDAEVTTVTFGPLAGLHRFYVRAVDDAGAADQTPAMREFDSDPDRAGAKLFVRTNVFGDFIFRGPIWDEQFNLPIPIFAGERLRFSWVASGDDYGGQIVGYRHAYDDTSTWPAWSIFDTHFEVIPEVGDHSLYIGALDNANVQTRARIRFEVIQASLDQYIVVVDDYNYKELAPSWGTDAMRDAFYDGLLAGYARDRFQWEPSQHTIAGDPQPPDVDALQGASTVIWYVDEEGVCELKDLFDPRKTTYNALAGYVRVGGNLLLCGFKATSYILDESYPIVVDASDTTQAVEFVRDFLHVGTAEESGSAINKDSPWTYGYCFYGATPAPGFEDWFDPVYIDSVGPEGYPDPGKWPVYTWQPPKPPGCFRGGLPHVEKLTAFQGTGLEFLQMDSYLNWNFEGETCGILHLTGDSHGNSCYLGFPLYYLKDDDAQSLVDKILELFGEEKLQ